MINIAICDDMPIICEILECMIHEYESQNDILFNVKVFESGEDLIENIRQCHTHFHLIFLDNHMKRLTGIETASYIRIYDESCQIVFVTSSESRYEFFQVAPLEILQKPAKKEKIYIILDKLLTTILK